MSDLFICPVCGAGLSEEEKLYKCPKGHSFDKSKFGYVNLLMSQSSSAKRHGDDRAMVRARRDFLSKGYYGFLLDELCRTAEKYFPSGSVILDAGCGECYYSSGILSRMSEKGIDLTFAGIDISKDALEFASKRKSGIKTAVAGVFGLPLAGGSLDGVLNIFSPEAFEEYRRVLRPGGVLIRVTPLEKHLFSLKSAIYDKPYLNEVPDDGIGGFELAEKICIRRNILLGSNEDVKNLFHMTPYFYKTGRDDQLKLESLEAFETEAEFGIGIYRKTN